MNFDSKEFRRCLGNFATGVTVVTAQADDGTRVGVTANSFNSVSLEPPLVLWSIVKSSNSFPVFEQAGHFAVNILAADQIDLSNNFARPGEDKFGQMDTRKGVGNSPLLLNTAANFQCKIHQILDGGDHWILIGQVMAFENTGRAPLLYVQGSYAGAIPFTGAKSAEDSVASPQTLARLHDSAIYLMNKVLQKIQENYLPKQASTGLNTSEARLLLVLSDTNNMTLEDLKHLATMPAEDVENSVGNLQTFGLINENYTLTDPGRDMAERLWSIADKQQEDLFQAFDEQAHKDFKHQLQQLLKQLS